MIPLSMKTRDIIVSCTDELTTVIKELNKSLRNLSDVNKKEKELQNQMSKPIENVRGGKWQRVN